MVLYNRYFFFIYRKKKESNNLSPHLKSIKKRFMDGDYIIVFFLQERESERGEKRKYKKNATRGLDFVYSN